MGDDDQAHQGNSWHINHYILAGLCATLIVSAVVTIASVVFSPAQVTFSVVGAKQQILPTVTNLMMAIAVYNPSRRCKARYQSVSISLRNSSTRAGKLSILCNVVPDKLFPMDYVGGPNVTLINSTALLVETEEDRDNGFAHRLNSSGGLTVEVRAQVRFKIGVTPTRLYDMNVFCPGVHFTDDNSSTAQANQQIFNCSS